ILLKSCQVSKSLSGGLTLTFAGRKQGLVAPELAFTLRLKNKVMIEQPRFAVKRVVIIVFPLLVLRRIQQVSCLDVASKEQFAGAVVRRSTQPHRSVIFELR